MYAFHLCFNSAYLCRELNRYEINYFVLIFVQMHVLIQCNAHVKIEMYKGKRYEVH